MKIVQWFKNLRFSLKLFVSYLLVAIFPISILGMYSYTQARQQLKSATLQNMNDLSIQLSDSMIYHIHNLENIFDYISFNTKIGQFFSQNYDDYTELTYELNNFIDPIINSATKLSTDLNVLSLYVENKMPEHGHFILSSERVDSLSWYKNASHKTAYYYENNKMFAVRVFSNLSSHTKLGVIYAEINLKTFLSPILSTSSPYNITLKTDKNRVLLDTNSVSKINFSDDSIYPNTEKVKNSPHNLMVEKTIPNLNWSISCSAPNTDIELKLGNLLFFAIGLIVLCIVLCIILISVFSQTFVSRILFLNRKMQAVALGDLSIKISSTSQDEVGQLINGFGSMIEKLHISIEEKNKSQQCQLEAELNALQAQINPHFLYNALSTINWKAIMHKETEISFLATSLSLFYRTTLNHGRRDILVKDEIDNAMAYMNIQLTLHKNKFTVIYNITDSIKEFTIINMILQPILENAIEHGIEGRTDNEGQITLSGYQQEDLIIFTIVDNGPGMTKEILQKFLTVQSEGYGMKNVQERITMRFGKNFGLSAESTSNQGTTITVRLPAIKKELKI